MGHHHVPVVGCHLKNRIIAQKGLDGAGVVGVTLANDLYIGHGDAAFKALAINFTITLDFGFHPSAQGIDGANAHAV